MKSSVYSFEPKIGLLDNKIFLHRDYFEFYTTGVESIIKDTPTAFRFTTRQNTERPEQIMYDIYSDADLSDVFVAINNQNYLWSTPFGLDAFQDAVAFRMNYVELLMRDRITKEDITDNLGNVIETTYNEVGDICYDKVREDIHNEDDSARTIIVPDTNSTQLVNRKIREYFTSRKVI